MAKSRQQVLDKYTRRMQGAGQDYVAGVQNPSKSWTENYVAAAPSMVANFQRAVNENRPQNAARQLGDAGWQQKTLAKADRFAAASQRAADGYAQKLDRILQAGEAGRAAAMAIDGNTFDGKMARVRANAEAITNFWRK